jgi:hypothetical protein
MTASPPCPLCQKTFLARRSLLRHLRNVHGRHDHRELVPSSKAGHDANRLRNRLGRFVRAGEENASLELNDVEVSTISESGSASTLRVVKPKLKKRALAALNDPVKRQNMMISAMMAEQSKPLLNNNISRFVQVESFFPQNNSNNPTTMATPGHLNMFPAHQQYMAPLQVVRYPVFVSPMAQQQMGCIPQLSQMIASPNMTNLANSMSPNMIQMSHMMRPTMPMF